MKAGASKTEADPKGSEAKNPPGLTPRGFTGTSRAYALRG